ncbi:hypothetical protein JTE90_014344 [Oedothorax gibbosus]|uniref:Uncharacterized protein n=1 Tax=Oedothorax gibbosus TaxID=931172 RepID=A0AAV6TLM2_9ARAC|nr:hypothetical protein JTE90_014344 [Oedothorax gibbosus]
MNGPSVSSYLPVFMLLCHIFDVQYSAGLPRWAIYTALNWNIALINSGFWFDNLLRDKSFGDELGLWLNANLIKDITLKKPQSYGMKPIQKVHPEVNYDTIPESKFPEVNRIISIIISKLRKISNPLCLLYLLNDVIALNNCPLYLITDIYAEQERSARMIHNNGTYNNYVVTQEIVKGDYTIPYRYRCTSFTAELEEHLQEIVTKGVKDMIDAQKFKNLTYDYMELLTSKSQGDRVIANEANVSTTSRFLAMLLNHDWLTSQSKFLDEIKKPTISSNRSQLYRRTRMVAAVNNAKQYFFMIIRLVIEATGKHDKTYGLAKQTGGFKDVASLMENSSSEYTMNFNGDIAGFDSSWSTTLMRFVVYKIIIILQDLLTSNDITEFGPFRWEAAHILGQDDKTSIDINPITAMCLYASESILSSNVLLRSLADASLQLGINVILSSGGFHTSGINTITNGALTQLSIKHSGFEAEREECVGDDINVRFKLKDDSDVNLAKKKIDDAFTKVYAHFGFTIESNTFCYKTEFLQEVAYHGRLAFKIQRVGIYSDERHDNRALPGPRLLDVYRESFAELQRRGKNECEAKMWLYFILLSRTNILISSEPLNIRTEMKDKPKQSPQSNKRIANVNCPIVISDCLCLPPVDHDCSFPCFKDGATYYSIHGITKISDLLETTLLTHPYILGDDTAHADHMNSFQRMFNQFADHENCYTTTFRNLIPSTKPEEFLNLTCPDFPKSLITPPCYQDPRNFSVKQGFKEISKYNDIDRTQFVRIDTTPGKKTIEGKQRYLHNFNIQDFFNYVIRLKIGELETDEDGYSTIHLHNDAPPTAKFIKWTLDRVNTQSREPISRLWTDIFRPYASSESHTCQERNTHSDVTNTEIKTNSTMFSHCSPGIQMLTKVMNYYPYFPFREKRNVIWVKMNGPSVSSYLPVFMLLCHIFDVQYSAGLPRWAIYTALNWNIALINSGFWFDNLLRDKSFGDELGLWLNANLIKDITLKKPQSYGMKPIQKVHPEVNYDTIPESKFPEVNRIISIIISKLRKISNPLCLLYLLNDVIALNNCPLYLITDIYAEQERSLA